MYNPLVVRSFVPTGFRGRAAAAIAASPEPQCPVCEKRPVLLQKYCSASCRRRATSRLRHGHPLADRLQPPKHPRYSFRVMNEPRSRTGHSYCVKQRDENASDSHWTTVSRWPTEDEAYRERARLEVEVRWSKPSSEAR